MAHLAFAHGASANDVSLNTCSDCEKDNGFLELMVSKGAKPNNDFWMFLALLHRFLLHDQFDAVDRWLRLGANPNGSEYKKRSMLSDIVGQCDRDKLLEQHAASKLEAAWNSCTAQTKARIIFAVARGADPNGQASPATQCETPYDVAIKIRSSVLAETLVALGADPAFGQRCINSK